MAFVHRIQFLRHMRNFFQIMYKVEVKTEDLEGSGEDEGEDTEEANSITRQLITVSCVGVGFSNYSKGIM